MLKDLKEFVVGSNVAEVGVGLSVGAAFTALVASVTDFGRGAIQGEWAWGGVSTAAIALVTVLLVSLVGVIKPLMSLRRKMTGGEVAAAVAETAPESDSETDAESAQQADAESADPTEALAAQVASPTAADTGVDALADAAAGAVPGTGTSADTSADTAAFAADPLGAPLPVQVAASMTGPGSVVLSGTSAAVAAAALEGPGGEEVASGTAPAAVVDLTAAEEPAATIAMPADAGAPSGDVEAAVPTPRAAVPYRAAELVACPHCAFDVPAAATRCGWCTSDLTAVAATA